MSSRPELCPVSPEEAVSVSQMAHEIWPVVYRDLISESQIQYMLDWMYDPAQIRRDMEEGICYCWIVGKENQQAGFTAFGPVEKGKFCELHKLYLKPEFHRQGLGFAALNGIESILREARSKQSNLRVNRNNHPASPSTEKQDSS